MYHLRPRRLGTAAAQSGCIIKETGCKNLQGSQPPIGQPSMASKPVIHEVLGGTVVPPKQLD